MPNVNGAVFMKNTSVSFDGVEYLGNTTKALLTPSQETQQVRTLDPGYVISDTDDPTWTLELAGPQVEIDGGLTDWMREHLGESVEVVLQPKRGSGQKTATFNVIIPAVPFGGEQGALATFDLTLVVEGAPVFGTSV